MKFYVFEVTTYINPVGDKTEKYAVTPKDDEYQAEILFHDKISAAMKDTNTATSFVFVKSELNVEVPELSRRYVNPATVPTPEPEEEENPIVVGG